MQRVQTRASSPSNSTQTPSNGCSWAFTAASPTILRAWCQFRRMSYSQAVILRMCAFIRWIRGFWETNSVNSLLNKNGEPSSDMCPPFLSILRPSWTKHWICWSWFPGRVTKSIFIQLSLLSLSCSYKRKATTRSRISRQAMVSLPTQIAKTHKSLNLTQRHQSFRKFLVQSASRMSLSAYHHAKN